MDEDKKPNQTKQTLQYLHKHCLQYVHKQRSIFKVQRYCSRTKIDRTEAYKVKVTSAPQLIKYNPIKRYGGRPIATCFLNLDTTQTSVELQ